MYMLLLLELVSIFFCVFVCCVYMSHVSWYMCTCAHVCMCGAYCWRVVCSVYYCSVY